MPAIRRTLAASSLAAACTVVLTLGVAGAASANPSPNGPGLPATGGGNGSVSCANYTTTPGNSAGARGSAFNPGGHAGSVYNPISEYDIACYQQTVHNH